MNSGDASSNAGAFLIIGLIASFTFLYKCNFPELEGGQGSLVYFAAIKGRTESTYKAEFEAVSDADYRADMLGQIWRNSHVLADKYKAIAMAIRLTLATLVPFTVFLVMTAIEHSRRAVPSVWLGPAKVQTPQPQDIDSSRDSRRAGSAPKREGLRGSGIRYRTFRPPAGMPARIAATPARGA